MTTPWVVAHRGDPLRLRENTLPSIEAAMVDGADCVEIDVKLTSDGVPVLLHDHTLGRLWGHARPVKDIAYDELQALTSTGQWRIPTLEEGLELAKKHRVPLMVDLPGPAEGLAALRLVRALGGLEDTVYCGNIDALATIRAAAADAVIAFSWRYPLLPRAELFRRVRPDYFNQKHIWVTRRNIDRAHRMGLKTCTYTVDRAPVMARLADAGIDAIITNDPPLLRRTLTDRQNR